jgi:hypothetical protein
LELILCKKVKRNKKEFVICEVSLSLSSLLQYFVNMKQLKKEKKNNDIGLYYYFLLPLLQMQSCSIFIIVFLIEMMLIQF